MRTATVMFVAATLLSTGCVSIESDLTVSEYDRVYGQVNLAFDLRAIEHMTEQLGGTFDEGESNGDTASASRGVSATVDRETLRQSTEALNDEIAESSHAHIGYMEHDGAMGLRVAFNGTPIEEVPTILELLASLDEVSQHPPLSLSITRVGGNHVLEGEILDALLHDVMIDLLGDELAPLVEELSRSEGSDVERGDEPPLIPEPDVRLVVRFAGEVAQANGEVDGATVTWREPGAISATAAAPRSSGWLFALAIGGGVPLLAVGGWVIRSRRRAAGRTSPEPPPESASQRATQ